MYFTEVYKWPSTPINMELEVLVHSQFVLSDINCFDWSHYISGWSVERSHQKS